MGRCRNRPRLGHGRGHVFVDFNLHIRGHEGDGVAFGADQDIRQNGDGVPPFHDALDMAEAFQKGGAFERNFHGDDSEEKWRRQEFDE